MTFEVWGGLECTMNRVGERFLDQFTYLEDLSPEEIVDVVASLGVRTLRFPVLWERVAPHGLEYADWSWPDRAMRRLQQHGIVPVIGLVHHGSGPNDTHLLDPRFPERLAAFARAVASRYPWVDRYTPVNEPLTTARFSALYGLWFPHARDDRSFATALFTQCAAIARAMEAIRDVQPAAQLVQTEDLGKTHATPRLAYQAEHENLRRWSSLDLLCGRAHDNPVLLRMAQQCAIVDFASYVSPPDLLGFNYYVTSERFLDERLERYPQLQAGSNGTDAYVDVEAVRVCVEGAAGLAELLSEASSRFGRPMAITESHLGCTRDEQLRWLAECFDAALDASEQGCDVRAFTFWALLGSHDWDRLLTRPDGHYEVGAFDIRSTPPRATAIAEFIRAATAGERFTHPVMAAPGWWRSNQRFTHPPASRTATVPPGELARAPAARPVGIIGGPGTLTDAFAAVCRLRSIPTVSALSRADIAERCDPWAIIDGEARWPDLEAAGAENLERFVHGVLDLLIDGECGDRDAEYPVELVGHEMPAVVVHGT